MPDSEAPSDPLANVRLLAPDVDVDGAHECFVSARRRAHRLQVVVTTTVVAAGVIVVFVAAIAFRPEHSSTNVAAGPGPGAGTVPAPNSFPLPAPGDAVSVLLTDGMPVWIVNHGDGTASAVPALFPTDAIGGPAAQVLYPVLWDADGAFDVLLMDEVPPQALTWDSHGRAIQGVSDLVGLSAVVRNGRVAVERSDNSKIAGSPIAVVRGQGRSSMPVLPETTSIDHLEPGWHQLNVDVVVDAAGGAALCPSIRAQGEPLGPVDGSPCETAVLHVPVLSLSETMRDGRMLSPVVVHVNDAMTVDAIYPKGGRAFAASAEN